MNKGGKGPRRGRRHSLPAIHTPLSYARAVPEGSDTFQQALEDLYNHEPSEAPPVSICEAAINRLSKIQEVDDAEEEEDEDSEEDEDELSNVRDPMIEQMRRMNRRFSSPVVISQEEIDKLRSRMSKGDNKKGTGVKKCTNLSKEYFIKHGHWPAPKARTANQNANKSAVAFGSTKQTKIKT